MKLFQLVIVIVLLSLLCFSCDRSENETIDGDIDSDSEVLENDNGESDKNEAEIDIEKEENEQEIELENFTPTDCSNTDLLSSNIVLDYSMYFTVSDYLAGIPEKNIQFVIESDNIYYLEYREFILGIRSHNGGENLESLKFSGILSKENINILFRNLYLEFPEPKNMCGYFGSSNCSHGSFGELYYSNNNMYNAFSYSCCLYNNQILKYIEELRNSISIPHFCAISQEIEKVNTIDFYYFDEIEGSKKFFVVAESGEWTFKKEYTNKNDIAKQQFCNGVFKQGDFETFITELWLKMGGIACMETTHDCKNSTGGYIYLNMEDTINLNYSISHFNCLWNHERVDQKSVAVPLEFLNQEIETLLKDCQ